MLRSLPGRLLGKWDGPRIGAGGLPVCVRRRNLGQHNRRRIAKSRLRILVSRGHVGQRDGVHLDGCGVSVCLPGRLLGK